MAVGDIYQGQIFYNLGSEQTMNVVHLKETVASTDDIPARTVGAILHNIWGTNWGTVNFGDGAKIPLIQVRRIKPTAGVPATLIIGTAAFPAIEGSAAGPPMPSSSAVLFSLYTNTFTKNGRGRIYVPGLSSGLQNDGQIGNAPIDELQAFADEFVATHVALAGMTGEYKFVVYSRELGTAQEVTQAIVHTNLASQRGRRNFPGLGT